jgi:transcription elongation factor Elf1
MNQKDSEQAEYICPNCGYKHTPLPLDILKIVFAVYCKGCGKEVKEEILKLSGVKE